MDCLNSSHCGRKAGYLFDVAGQIPVVLDPGFGHVLTEKSLDRRVGLPSIPWLRGVCLVFLFVLKMFRHVKCVIQGQSSYWYMLFHFKMVWLSFKNLINIFLQCFYSVICSLKTASGKLIMSTNLFLLFEEVKELFLLFDRFSGDLLLGYYDWSLHVYRVLLKVHCLWGLGLK